MKTTKAIRVAVAGAVGMRAGRSQGQGSGGSGSNTWMVLRPCTVMGRLGDKRAEETIKARLENSVKVPQKIKNRTTT